MTPRFFWLDGRTAVVTGGGQGIGEAISRRLAAAGARVVVFDRSAEAAERVAQAIGGLGIAGDVTSEADIAAAVQRVEGGIDILVNNAGITGKAARCWELAREDMESVMQVNLIGPWLW